MFSTWLRKLFQSKSIKKDFIITDLTLYNDTSYGLSLPSIRYTAIDINSGQVVSRYIYGSVMSAEQLKIALDNGHLPGRTFV